MTLQLKTFGVHLKVADIERSRQFYESIGFVPVIAFGSSAFLATFAPTVRTVLEKYRGVIYRIGTDAELEIAEDHPAVLDKATFQNRLDTAKVSAMVKVDSVVPLFENPLLAITFPIRHYYWAGGVIEVAFRDPDGFVIVFIAPFSEAEATAIRRYRQIETVAGAAVGEH